MVDFQVFMRFIVRIKKNPSYYRMDQSNNAQTMESRLEGTFVSPNGFQNGLLNIMVA